MGDPMEAVALLEEALKHKTQKEVAALLDVDAKTVSRWKSGKIQPSSVVALALREIVTKEPKNASGCHDFTFIDLFAGIGGIRMGFQQHGGKCVFTSEWNTWSQKTYAANFGDDHEINGDITKIDEHEVPDHDVLLAGFPCQPFSIAGVSKKNALGRPHGFECTTQGTLFFDVARIIAAKRPKAFLLENVKNLVSHDKGNTFRVIMETLRNELGYKVEARVIDAKHFVPQHRERIIIVGFREDTGFSFDALRIPEEGPKLESILHPENGTEVADGVFTIGEKAKVPPKYVLTDKLWAYLQNYAAKHKAAGNGFGFGLVNKNMISRTLSARYYKDGSEILIDRGAGKNPRRLTPRECARLMGFPEDWKIPVSDTQAYRQFGNAVAVPIITEVARIMKPHIMALVQQEEETPQARLFAA
ncbi:DNA (cytosine-5-)-methyltransferase [Azonexus hydrophilus]|uniref:Cytosine-specific methyltransferase n=1 Tax=Azonexus hydrophilus TaxID=418702 RepID=A0A1R1ID75_9RHOO|nr:DNA (cytosine-5-)-methyltransferase [Azonexus hydrophilus]OMG56600.1 DNA (cytosine-5-)-methyltransferase [Azonexus hydrophilus]